METEAGAAEILLPTRGDGEAVSIKAVQFEKPVTESFTVELKKCNESEANTEENKQEVSSTQVEISKDAVSNSGAVEDATFLASASVPTASIEEETVASESAKHLGKVQQFGILDEIEHEVDQNGGNHDVQSSVEPKPVIKDEVKVDRTEEESLEKDALDPKVEQRSFVEISKEEDKCTESETVSEAILSREIIEKEKEKDQFEINEVGVAAKDETERESLKSEVELHETVTSPVAKAEEECSQQVENADTVKEEAEIGSENMDKESATEVMEKTENLKQEEEPTESESIKCKEQPRDNFSPEDEKVVTSFNEGAVKYVEEDFKGEKEDETVSVCDTKGIEVPGEETEILPLIHSDKAESTEVDKDQKLKDGLEREEMYVANETVKEIPEEEVLKSRAEEKSYERESLEEVSKEPIIEGDVSRSTPKSTCEESNQSLEKENVKDAEDVKSEILESREQGTGENFLEEEVTIQNDEKSKENLSEESTDKIVKDDNTSDVVPESVLGDVTEKIEEQENRVEICEGKVADDAEIKHDDPVEVSIKEIEAEIATDEPVTAKGNDENYAQSIEQDSKQQIIEEATFQEDVKSSRDDVKHDEHIIEESRAVIVEEGNVTNFEQESIHEDATEKVIKGCETPGEVLHETDNVVESSVDASAAQPEESQHEEDKCTDQVKDSEEEKKLNPTCSTEIVKDDDNDSNVAEEGTELEARREEVQEHEKDDEKLENLVHVTPEQTDTEPSESQGNVACLDVQETDPRETSETLHGNVYITNDTVKEVPRELVHVTPEQTDIESSESHGNVACLDVQETIENPRETSETLHENVDITNDAVKEIPRDLSEANENIPCKTNEDVVDRSVALEEEKIETKGKDLEEENEVKDKISSEVLREDDKKDVTDTKEVAIKDQEQLTQNDELVHMTSEKTETESSEIPENLACLDVQETTENPIETSETVKKDVNITNDSVKEVPRELGEVNDSTPCKTSEEVVAQEEKKGQESEGENEANEKEIKVTEEVVALDQEDKIETSETVHAMDGNVTSHSENEVPRELGEVNEELPCKSDEGVVDEPVASPVITQEDGQGNTKEQGKNMDKESSEVLPQEEEKEVEVAEYRDQKQLTVVEANVGRVEAESSEIDANVTCIDVDVKNPSEFENPKSDSVELNLPITTNDDVLERSTEQVNECKEEVLEERSFEDKEATNLVKEGEQIETESSASVACDCEIPKESAEAEPSESTPLKTNEDVIERPVVASLVKQEEDQTEQTGQDVEDDNTVEGKTDNSVVTDDCENAVRITEETERGSSTQTNTTYEGVEGIKQNLEETRDTESNEKETETTENENDSEKQVDEDLGTAEATEATPCETGKDFEISVEPSLVTQEESALSKENEFENTFSKKKATESTKDVSTEGEKDEVHAPHADEQVEGSHQSLEGISEQANKEEKTEDIDNAYEPEKPVISEEQGNTEPSSLPLREEQLEESLKEPEKEEGTQSEGKEQKVTDLVKEKEPESLDDGAKPNEELCTTTGKEASEEDKVPEQVKEIEDDKIKTENPSEGIHLKEAADTEEKTRSFEIENADICVKEAKLDEDERTVISDVSRKEKDSDLVSSAVPIEETSVKEAEPECEEKTRSFEIENADIGVEEAKFNEEERTEISDASREEKDSDLVTSAVAIEETSVKEAEPECEEKDSDLVTSAVAIEETSVKEAEPECEEKTRSFEIENADIGVKEAKLDEEEGAGISDVFREEKDSDLVSSAVAIEETSVKEAEPEFEEKTRSLEIENADIGVKEAKLDEEERTGISGVSHEETDLVSSAVAIEETSVKEAEPECEVQIRNHDIAPEDDCPESSVVKEDPVKTSDITPEETSLKEVEPENADKGFQEVEPESEKTSLKEVEPKVEEIALTEVEQISLQEVDLESEKTSPKEVEPGGEETSLKLEKTALKEVEPESEKTSPKEVEPVSEETRLKEVEPEKEETSPKEVEPESEEQIRSHNVALEDSVLTIIESNKTSLEEAELSKDEQLKTRDIALEEKDLDIKSPSDYVPTKTEISETCVQGNDQVTVSDIAIGEKTLPSSVDTEVVQCDSVSYASVNEEKVTLDYVPETKVQSDSVSAEIPSKETGLEVSETGLGTGEKIPESIGYVEQKGLELEGDEENKTPCELEEKEIEEIATETNLANPPKDDHEDFPTVPSEYEPVLIQTSEGSDENSTLHESQCENEKHFTVEPEEHGLLQQENSSKLESRDPDKLNVPLEITSKDVTPIQVQETVEEEGENVNEQAVDEQILTREFHPVSTVDDGVYEEKDGSAIITEVDKVTDTNVELSTKVTMQEEEKLNDDERAKPVDVCVAVPSEEKTTKEFKGDAESRSDATETIILGEETAVTSLAESESAKLDEPVKEFDESETVKLEERSLHLVFEEPMEKKESEVRAETVDKDEEETNDETKTTSDMSVNTQEDEITTKVMMPEEEKLNDDEGAKPVDVCVAVPLEEKTTEEFNRDVESQSDAIETAILGEETVLTSLVEYESVKLDEPVKELDGSETVKLEERSLHLVFEEPVDQKESEDKAETVDKDEMKTASDHQSVNTQEDEITVDQAPEGGIVKEQLQAETNEPETETTEKAEEDVTKSVSLDPEERNIPLETVPKDVPSPAEVHESIEKDDESGNEIEQVIEGPSFTREFHLVSTIDERVSEEKDETAIFNEVDKETNTMEEFATKVTVQEEEKLNDDDGVKPVDVCVALPLEENTADEFKGDDENRSHGIDSTTTLTSLAEYECVKLDEPVNESDDSKSVKVEERSLHLVFEEPNGPKDSEVKAETIKQGEEIIFPAVENKNSEETKDESVVTQADEITVDQAHEGGIIEEPLQAESKEPETETTETTKLVDCQDVVKPEPKLGEASKERLQMDETKEDVERSLEATVKPADESVQEDEKNAIIADRDLLIGIPAEPVQASSTMDLSDSEPQTTSIVTKAEDDHKDSLTVVHESIEKDDESGNEKEQVTDGVSLTREFHPESTVVERVYEEKDASTIITEFDKATDNSEEVSTKVIMPEEEKLTDDNGAEPVDVCVALPSEEKTLDEPEVTSLAAAQLVDEPVKELDESESAKVEERSLHLVFSEPTEQKDSEVQSETVHQDEEIIPSGVENQISKEAKDELKEASDHQNVNIQEDEIRIGQALEGGMVKEQVLAESKEFETETTDKKIEEELQDVEKTELKLHQDPETGVEQSPEAVVKAIDESVRGDGKDEIIVDRALPVGIPAEPVRKGEDENEEDRKDEVIADRDFPIGIPAEPVQAASEITTIVMKEDDENKEDGKDAINADQALTIGVPTEPVQAEPEVTSTVTKAEDEYEGDAKDETIDHALPIGIPAEPVQAASEATCTEIKTEDENKEDGKEAIVTDRALPFEMTSIAMKAEDESEEGPEILDTKKTEEALEAEMAEEKKLEEAEEYVIKVPTEVSNNDVKSVEVGSEEEVVKKRVVFEKEHDGTTTVMVAEVAKEIKVSESDSHCIGAVTEEKETTNEPIPEKSYAIQPVKESEPFLPKEQDDEPATGDKEIEGEKPKEVEMPGYENSESSSKNTEDKTCASKEHREPEESVASVEASPDEIEKATLQENKVCLDEKEPEKLEVSSREIDATDFTQKASLEVPKLDAGEDGEDARNAPVIEARSLNTDECESAPDSVPEKVASPEPLTSIEDVNIIENHLKVAATELGTEETQCEVAVDAEKMTEKESSHMKELSTETALEKSSLDVDEAHETCKERDLPEVEATVTTRDVEIPSKLAETTQEASPSHHTDREIKGEKEAEPALVSLSDLMQDVKEEKPNSENLSKEADETETSKEVEHEKAKTDEEKDEHEDEHDEEEEHDESEHPDAPILVQSSKDIDDKASRKKSHGLFSGVGSKVKHSISKVKKAITGKSTHPKTPPSSS